MLDQRVLEVKDVFSLLFHTMYETPLNQSCEEREKKRKEEREDREREKIERERR